MDWTLKEKAPDSRWGAAALWAHFGTDAMSEGLGRESVQWHLWGHVDISFTFGNIY